MSVRDIRFGGDVERARKKCLHIRNDIDGRIDAVAIVHDDDRRVVIRDDARHVRVALQPPDIVGDGNAATKRPVGDRCFHGVDRHRRAKCNHF